MSYTVITVQQDFVSIDLLCWRHYKTTAGTIEAVYNSNPGISKWNVFLPVGLEVKMPDLAIAPVQSSIKLWEDSP